MLNDKAGTIFVEFKLMRKSVLINTARVRIVDEMTLVDTVSKRRG